MTTYRVNAFLACLIVTIVGGGAAMTIVHVANNDHFAIIQTIDPNLSALRDSMQQKRATTSAAANAHFR